jgi:hypothetical protein
MEVIPMPTKKAEKVPELSTEQKLLAIQKYVGDLCFVAPEIFPTGQQVQYRVGQILGMWA